MVEPRGDLDLAQEPLGPQGLRQLGAQHFERDATVVLEIVRDVKPGSFPQAAQQIAASGNCRCNSRMSM